jgi:hypothetical protein
VKKIILILFLFAGVFVHAQDFASVGTTWTYSDHENGGYHSYPRAIFSVADTVVNGHPSHLVIGNCLCSGVTGNYLYELNRRVYMYHLQLGQFTLLYDFNLNAGEHYIFHPQNAADSFYVVVDSISTDTINGNIKKSQYVHTQYISGMLSYSFNGKIIEGIGSVGCLYPQIASCSPSTDGLRCYQDNVLGFYDTHLAPACDTVYVTFDKVEEINRMMLVRVAPNPFSEKTTLHFDKNNLTEGSISIYDLTGRIVREEKFIGNSIVIERNNLESGVYYYILSLKESKATGKLIID